MDPLGLTKRQAQVLHAIGSHFRAHGYAPSYDEIAAATRHASKGQVSLVVRALVYRGYVTCRPAHARSTRLTAAGEEWVRAHGGGV